MRLKDMLEKLLKDVVEMKSDMIEMKADLKYHIRRTDILQEELQKHREDFRPIKRHVEFVRGLFKLVLWLAGVGASVAAIINRFL